MTKEEYTEKLTKYYEENKLQEADSYGEGYTDGLAEALDYAIDLAEKLDEPKKVVIPKFVDDWIKEYSKVFTPLGIVSQILNKNLEEGVQNHWRNDEDNQKLLLNAIANGYEVEKQKKYRVKIDSKLYFQRFENIEAVFVIDDSLGVKESSPVFTREVGNKILETLGVESGQLEEAEDE